MTKLEECTEAIRAIPFNLPGAGGLRGELRLAKAQSLDIVRAVLEALREPTPEMAEAAGKVMPWVLTDDTTFEEQQEMAKDGWTAMIDTILSEQEKG